MEFFRTALVFMSVAASITGICSWPCESPSKFKCLGSNNCFYRRLLCDDSKDCEDGTDEGYCTSADISKAGGCPPNWFMCSNGGRCIPREWLCDKTYDCRDKSDEETCRDSVAEKMRTILINKMFDHETGRRADLFRAVIAMHFIDRSTLEGYYRIEKLKLQILSAITTRDLKNNELALTIGVLLVTCSDPSDFYGFDLVSELSARVTASRKPRAFDLIILCNARDNMANEDEQKAIDTFFYKNNRHSKEYKAMSILAQNCMQYRSTKPFNTTNMERELMEWQDQKGTFGSFRTTALVLQALAHSDSMDQYRYEDGVTYLLKAQKNGNLNSTTDLFYLAPLLDYSNFVSINGKHCKPELNRLDASRGFQTIKGASRVIIRCSIIMDNKTMANYTLYLPKSRSLHYVTQIMNVLDDRHRVKYYLVDHMPYLSNVNDLVDDLILGMYWYVFVKSPSGELQMRNETLVNILVKPGVEYILWYKEIEY